ncbi:MAG: nucleoside kinase [Longicatena sp.]
MIKLRLSNNDIIEVEKGTSILKVIQDRSDSEHIYGGIFKGSLHELTYLLKEDGDLTFIYDKSTAGILIYERTLNFLLIVAVHLLFKDASVHMEHALSRGQYCDIIKPGNITPQDVEQIRAKMLELVSKKKKITRNVIPTKEAIAYFESIGMENKANLLRERNATTSTVYSLCNWHDYFYGFMLPDTSYIKHFSICFYSPGLWLSAEATFYNQTNLFGVFQEFETWGKLIDVSNVAQLNEQIQHGHMNDLVLMSEAMIEKKLAELAVKICTQRRETKFVIIAGPSSAGKTTFSKRLAIHLKILGKTPLAISMDDFYKNREECPTLADGTYDFECIEALDTQFFNETMLNLLQKKPVKLPIFNFKTGLREWADKETRLGEGEILIIEGIHGLNPKATTYLPEEAKFKIYINALTHLKLDEHNRIPTSDYRLIRRIARDNQFRAISPQENIAIWKNVQNGEDKYIYPYQEEADIIFNSSMIYELPILKKIVVPLLNKVGKEDLAYLEANRLKNFLLYFADGDASAVPRSSILAEFIGNSIFDVS